MKKYHYANENVLIYSSGNRLYIQEGESTTSLLVKEVLPDSLSLIRRMLRSDIHNAIMCKDTLIVVVRGKLLFYRSGKPVGQLLIIRGKRPLRDGIVCFGNDLFYGDYWMNPQRDKANIYRVDLLTLKQEIFFSFDRVQHIHFVQKDHLFVESLLIGTGDRNNECGIYRLDTRSGEIETLLEGSQKYRLVSVIQVKEYLIWGTDAPNEDNYIYRFDRKNKVLKRLQKIGGPAYYSALTKKGYMYIATTIEQRGRHQAIIYESKDKGLTWNEYEKFQKDIWHCRYFGYGIIEFISGQEYCDKLFFNKIGLK